MFWLKQCPRCKGDLFLDHDSYGKHVRCVQCGHYWQASDTEERATIKTCGYQGCEMPGTYFIGWEGDGSLRFGRVCAMHDRELGCQNVKDGATRERSEPPRKIRPDRALVNHLAERRLA